MTSSGPTEGKSTVAANLGAVYAQAGLKTVIVSADLRRPRVDAIFGVPGGVVGLTDVIAGFAELGRPTMNGNGPEVISVDPSLSAALRPTDVDNLFLLPSGKLPPNPSELLGSQKTAEVIEALSGLADMVIIDTPPVLAVTDSSILAPRVDGVVVVASANQTHKGALGRTVSTLSNTRARMLGLVLNKVEDKGGSGYGGRYYGKYYRSYYGQGPQKRSVLSLRRGSKADAG
ncbi:MAG: CpsD/CapB family tyrosine-protein kinase [Acidimicrobiia bacterium]